MKEGQNPATAGTKPFPAIEEVYPYGNDECPVKFLHRNANLALFVALRDFTLEDSLEDFLNFRDISEAQIWHTSRLT